MLDEVILTKDEWEAVRLADLEGLYQESAAEMMKISRPTFGRIIESAHRKIADALVNGKALKIDGGNVDVSHERPPVNAGQYRRRCYRRGNPWRI